MNRRDSPRDVLLSAGSLKENIKVLQCVPEKVLYFDLPHVICIVCLPYL